MSTEKNADIARRNLLKGIAIVPVALALGHAGSAYAVNLDPNDPVAKSLGYVEKSKTAGQMCSGCNLYKAGKTEGRGSCQIFVGKEVAADGWCKSWVKKV